MAGLPRSGLLVNRGDQSTVCFCIKFPSAVNDRQRIILEEFAKEEIIQESDVSLTNNGLSYFGKSPRSDDLVQDNRFVLCTQEDCPYFGKFSGSDDFVLEYFIMY